MKNVLQEIMAFVSFTLILIGIGGVSFELFKDNGLLERFLDIVWETETRQPLLMIPTAGGALVLTSVFLRGGLTPGKHGKGIFANTMILLCMACGAYYAYQWIVNVI